MAAVRWKTKRRDKRVEAAKNLAALAEELHVKPVLSLRAPVNAEVERLVCILEGRACEAQHVTRLRAAAKLWSDNGGIFSAPLADPDELGLAGSALRQHRVLAATFELHSKAFMLTYNSAAFTKATWEPFRKFVLGLKKAFGARAWAACLELSLHAADAAGERFHLHAYLLWNDGVGFRSRDITPFYFQGVRPRVDVCTARSKTTAPHTAACHGLWYVATMKDGTIISATNYEAGVWYKPTAKLACLAQSFSHSPPLQTHVLTCISMQSVCALWRELPQKCAWAIVTTSLSVRRVAPAKCN